MRSSEAELAVACASHSGDRVHLDAVRSLLAKAGLDESTLACGAHWPVSEEATRELMRARQRPRAIHNNCSGKHAGMLATAQHLGLDPRGYEQPDHPRAVDDRGNHFRDLRSRARSDAHGHRRLLGADLRAAACVPWREALRGSAAARDLPPERASAARRLLHACFAEPLHVAGEGRFDTIVLRGLAPSCFVKGGAEGVHCAALPELGLGIALKIDDGAKRAAELVMSELLAALLPEARQVLADQLAGEIRNWKGVVVGRVVPSELLQAGGVASTRPIAGRASNDFRCCVSESRYRATLE